MRQQALVLDFGGVISRTLFETHALSEAALGLPAGTLTWRGPFDPANDALWRDMQADRISERDYWLARTREVGRLLGEDWDRMETFVQRARGADVQAIIRLLEQQRSLGGVFGSRTQSRRQFITSVRAAYGERRLLYTLGKAAAFFLSTLFYLRTGVIFSDPLTGLRVFRRQRLAHLPDMDQTAPLAIVRQMIRHGVEVAELPVIYRTYSGFTDPYWRIRRGLRNLASLI